MSLGGCGRLGASDAGRSLGGCVGWVWVGLVGCLRQLERWSVAVRCRCLRVLRVLCVGRSMSVTRAGLLRVHGPLGNRCAGSECRRFFLHVPLPMVLLGPLFPRVHLPVMRMSASMANLSETLILLVPGLCLFIPSFVRHR